MYQTSHSDHSSKGMKVKHLVQLVSLTVLFTWLLYQLNSSHQVKVASLRLRADEIEDDGAGGLNDASNLLDIFSDIDLGRVGDEILSRSLLRQKNIQPAELREIEREENNNGVDELEQVADEGDDSGEGDGDEGAVNLLDQDEQVRGVDEIEGEGELKEESAPEGIVAEESEALEQPGRLHPSKLDPAS
ncbi:hypothetical protein Mp_1g03820 [Marchantia polymorpha subsp. ruderalis]|uniref:Uncharacterized protein n=2 Tax=Marchantia polymorpha TaxID=3197 RepID=A0AAF6AL85_MARPO|nr:hypothetical protein MARPO_0005s0225 [Marchantia polymorpha]BBM97205.1 hypothetical protein Mp_1g03820 [Marchantia polymorpha subsp. ruderalis]|eukprot:PTQ48603.1 hypothetical protein MARPO_0005s0225 [Marchantia polymorpha]